MVAHAAAAAAAAIAEAAEAERARAHGVELPAAGVTVEEMRRWTVRFAEKYIVGARGKETFKEGDGALGGASLAERVKLAQAVHNRVTAVIDAAPVTGKRDLLPFLTILGAAGRTLLASLNAPPL